MPNVSDVVLLSRDAAGSKDRERQQRVISLFRKFVDDEIGDLRKIAIEEFENLKSLPLQETFVNSYIRALIELMEKAESLSSKYKCLQGGVLEQVLMSDEAILGLIAIEFYQRAKASPN